MKKNCLIILSLLALLLSGCGTEKENPIPQACEYCFSYNTTDRPGVEISAVIYEYNEIGERIAYRNIKDVRNGVVKYFTADDKAVKVKACLTVKNALMEQNWWIGIVYYLTPGEIVKIEVDSNTRMNNNEP